MYAVVMSVIRRYEISFIIWLKTSENITLKVKDKYIMKKTNIITHKMIVMEYSEVLFLCFLLNGRNIQK